MIDHWEVIIWSLLDNQRTDWDCADVEGVVMGDSKLLEPCTCCLGHDLIQQRMLSQKKEDTETKVTLNQAGTNKKFTACNIKRWV